MPTLRAAICGHGEAHPDADECPGCLRRWEAEQARDGSTEAPCIDGHLSCAHREGGACHADPGSDCAIPSCEWRFDYA
jgi:hypothetical protein